MIITPKQAVDVRDKLGFTQTRVCKATGLSRTYLSQFELGKLELSPERLSELRSFYEQQMSIAGLDPSDFFGPNRKADVAEKAVKELHDQLGQPLTDELVKILSELVDLAAFPVDPGAYKPVPEQEEFFKLPFADEVISHFQKDAAGETQGGFFGGERTGRVHHLVALMAFGYLKLLQEQDELYLVPLPALKAPEDAVFGKDAGEVAEFLSELYQEASTPIVEVA